MPNFCIGGQLLRSFFLAEKFGVLQEWSAKGVLNHLWNWPQDAALPVKKKGKERNKKVIKSFQSKMARWTDKTLNSWIWPSQIWTWVEDCCKLWRVSQVTKLFKKYLIFTLFIPRYWNSWDWFSNKFSAFVTDITSRS